MRAGQKLKRSKIFFSYLFPVLICMYVTFNNRIIDAQNKLGKTVKIKASDLILTNEKPKEQQRFVSAGHRCYITGMQNGNFPPMGWHNVDEMGGVWIPPLKAADGIWLRINGKYIVSAEKYIRKAAWSEHNFISDNLSVNRKDLALDNQPGALIMYTIKNNSGRSKNLLLDLIIRFHPILSYPFVQGEEDYSKNKKAFEFNTAVKYDSSLHCLIAYTDRFNRFAVCKTNIQPDKISYEKQNDLPIRKSKSFFQSSEADAVMSFNLSVKPGDDLKLITGIAGSLSNSQEAASAAAEIVVNVDRLLVEKGNRYVELANKTALTTPDDTINTAFLWNKLNMAMETISVPGLGTGVVAGYPDYPWYFGNDGSYSVPALLAIGQSEEAKNHLRLLASVSNKVNNSSGKIVHEIVTDGSVYWGRNTDPGNTNETCQFAKASGQVWKWTGDESFLKEIYPTIKKGMLDWLINTKINKGDIFPSGYGNAEETGLGSKRLDVQCYAVEGLLALADMARYLGDDESQKKAVQWAEKIKAGINSTWWLEDKGYYANSLTEDNKPVLKSSISPVPLESKVADSVKGNILLESISKSNENNEYGWGPMSIGSGIAAEAEANSGRTEEALQYIKGIARLYNYEMPGGLPEHNPPYPTSPGHLQWTTNAVQLWGGYGLHFPLIRNILGVAPEIPDRTIKVTPNLPESWDRIECNNLSIGNDTLSLRVQRVTNTLSVKVIHSGNNKLEVGAFLPRSAKIRKVICNGAEYPQSSLIVNEFWAGRELFIKTDVKEVLLQIETEHGSQ